MIFILAFLLPAVMYAVTLAATKTFPFGDKALLISDIDNQFAAFYTYFKHALLSNDNFIYSFSKTLGGDMTGFSGYYLNNPFLFLLFFFKDEYIPAGIVLIIGLQFSLMGLTMALLLKDIKSESNAPGNAAILACSCAYAFMGFNLAYITLPIYFSSLILLPLVMLGIRHIVKKNSNKLYIISLTLSIIFNYYIGYMICIFSVLYFLYLLISENRLKDKGRYLNFILSSVLSGALSAFTVLPTVLSLRGQKDAPALSALKPSRTYGIRALVRNLFVGGFKGDSSNYAAPYIYVGEALLIFLLIYFISKRIGLRRKLASAGLLFILLISTYISTFDVIWHGFNEPVGFSHRYAFLICAVLITLGFEGMALITENPDKSGTKPSRLASVLLYAALPIEVILLIINAVMSIGAYEQSSLSSYRTYYSRMDKCIKSIKEDDGFYRIEKDFEKNHNDAMMLSYSGLTHNSSCEKDYIKQFAAKMGLRYFSPIWTFYNHGSTTFTDCFLGVKYFASWFDSTDKPYKPLFNVQGATKNGDERTVFVYENPYVLPLCFGMEEEKLGTDMEDANLFNIQNGLAGTTIYTPVTAPIKNITDEEITVSVVMDNDCNLYFYATAPDYQGAELYVNEESREDYFSVSRWNIVNLGNFNKGDMVNIKLRATDGPITVNELYLYAEDLSALKSWYDNAGAKGGELKKITSSHLSGRISLNDGDRLMFSIPYEKGWKVRLDGKKIDTIPALGALLSVRALPGDHEIDMVYIPQGLIPGIAVSVTALIICLGLTFCPQTIKIVLRRFCKKNREEKPL